MNGKGAALYPGRWNRRGQPAVYLAETFSLCVLEIALQAGTMGLKGEWLHYRLELPDEMVTTLNEKDWPHNWRQEPAPDSTRLLGTKFLERGQGLALRVPSLTIPNEWLYLVNPLHPSFVKLLEHKPIAWRW